MFKHLVFVVFLWQYAAKDVSCINVDNVPNLPRSTLAKDCEKGLSPERNVTYNFYAPVQITNWPELPTNHTSLCNVRKEIRFDYKLINGVGAYKLHLRKLRWNDARKVCMEEGGQLAVLKTQSEQTMLEEMMHDYDIKNAWVGYHDLFDRDDWVSVLGEPLETGWDRWSHDDVDKGAYGGSRDCIYLVKAHGIYNKNCWDEYEFACKISID